MDLIHQGTTSKENVILEEIEPASFLFNGTLVEEKREGVHKWTEGSFPRMVRIKGSFPFFQPSDISHVSQSFLDAQVTNELSTDYGKIKS